MFRLKVYDDFVINTIKCLKPCLVYAIEFCTVVSLVVFARQQVCTEYGALNILFFLPDNNFQSRRDAILENTGQL